MASGEFAKPIYDLLAECGGMPDNGSTIVLEELIKFLPGETIKEFVETFRQNHDMKENIVQTHFSANVDDETEDFDESSHFFSSRIPEC